MESTSFASQCQNKFSTISGEHRRDPRVNSRGARIRVIGMCDQADLCCISCIHSQIYLSQNRLSGCYSILHEFGNLCLPASFMSELSWLDRFEEIRFLIFGQRQAEGYCTERLLQQPIRLTLWKAWDSRGTQRLVRKTNRNENPGAFAGSRYINNF